MPAGIEELYAAGRYAESSEQLLQAFATASPPHHPQAFSLLARSLANQGRLRTAVSWCERWIAIDKLNPVAHYILAMVLQELGEHAAARRALQQVLYLDPGFILAHFALGNLARVDGKPTEANRHFSNALDLLSGTPAGELLPQSDGLTAGRLREIIQALMALAHPRGAAA